MATGTNHEQLDPPTTRDTSLPPRNVKGRRWLRDVLFLILGALVSLVQDYWREEKQRIEKLDADVAEASRYMESAQPDQISKAIAIYESNLREIRREKEALRYADVNRQIGVGYLLLSQHDKPDDRLEAARLAFENALAIYQQDKTAPGLARTRGQLAATHLQLADLANTKINLQIALKLAEQASIGLNEFRSEDIENQINLCKIHRRMADLSLDGSALTHLSIGLEAANHALGKLAGMEFPPLQSQALICRGNIFLARSNHEDKKTNLLRAISDYEGAAEFSTLQRSAFTFAEIQSNIGSAHTYLAEVEDKSLNLHKAIAAYDQSLDAYDRRKYFYKRAVTQANMAEAYRSLAGVEKRLENLEHALAQYKEAGESLPAAEYKLHYARLQANTGRVYGDIAKIKRKAANYREAIAHYRKALNVFKEGEYPAWYAQVHFELGEAFENLATVEDRQTNLLEAWKCYKAAVDKLPAKEYEPLRKLLEAKLTRLEARLGLATKDSAKEL